MKKIIIYILACLLCMTTYASAMSFTFNINGTGNQASDGAIQFDSWFDTVGQAFIFNDFSNGATFDEIAAFAVTGNSGDAFGAQYPWGTKELTAVFEATGTIDTTDQSFSFDNVIGSLKFYVDDLSISPTTGNGSTNDTVDSDNFYGDNNGKLIATWNLVGGGGNLADNYTPLNGTISAFFELTSMENGYFYDLFGNDLSNYTGSTLTVGLATVNASLNNPANQKFAEEVDELANYTIPKEGGKYTTDLNLDPTNGDYSQHFNVGNNGQFRIDVVPEPGTLLLVGFGLLGLAGIGRKRANS